MHAERTNDARVAHRCTNPKKKKKKKKKRAAVADLLVHLDPDGGEPLRRQLAGELREAIRAGRLRTGVRLPASRALAASSASPAAS